MTRSKYSITSPLFCWLLCLVSGKQWSKCYSGEYLVNQSVFSSVTLEFTRHFVATLPWTILFSAGNLTNQWSLGGMLMSKERLAEFTWLPVCKIRGLPNQLIKLWFKTSDTTFIKSGPNGVCRFIESFLPTGMMQGWWHMFCEKHWHRFLRWSDSVIGCSASQAYLTSSKQNNRRIQT